MTDEIALWKQRISEPKANGQTIMDWCTEHNETKGSYHYWRRRVMQAEEAAPPHHPAETKAGTKPVVFAKTNITEPVQSPLKVTWKDVRIHLTSSQDAHLAAELIAHLRRSC